MRIFLSAISAIALIAPLQSYAATIVQIGYSSSLGGFFNRFDTSLGGLNAVRLDLEVNSKRALYVTGPLPAGVPNTIPIEWSINGFAKVDLQLAGASAVTTNFIPISGAGSGAIDWPGLLFTEAKGAGGFDIDPGTVLWDPNQLGNHVYYDAYVPGLYHPEVDTTFSSPYPVNIIGLAECDGGSGIGGCSNVKYTLTYDYTAVPEPITWVMMLVGFGMIGIALRRRPKGAAVDRYRRLRRAAV